MSNLYYTKEHDEVLDFSDPVLYENVTVMVKDEDSGDSGAGSFLDSVVNSFEKTFIRENRWKLLVKGTGITLLITLLSIIFGSILGFAVFMICRKGNPAANMITRLCIRLVQGLPVVVFLMILNYIIFGKVHIPGVFVSVICFTIIFGAAVYSMLKTGVGTVDRGQTEAAYALGYQENRMVFFHIVLPQAMPYILSSFIEQVKALIKATAIVGYIAVQDLTKMGDIIRSRTYDAFFPLIAVAVIYFILADILGFLAQRTGKMFDTKSRRHKKLLKGVEFHD
jgi:polar amino acid transport system substrate-binding protein